MPVLVKAPEITYKCKSCGAVSKAEPDEFVALHTMPPTFRCKCAFCHASVVCSPDALIARLVHY